MDAPQQQQPPQEDISSKTILLLVVLTLAVSFIGAWVNINTAMTATAPATAPAQSTAEVNFVIQGPRAPPPPAVASGMVAFDITQ